MNIPNPVQVDLSNLTYYKLLYSPTGEYNNKTEICNMMAADLWKVTDKEISEIKINSVPKNTKYLCKNTVRLGEYSPILTSPSANNC